MTEMTETPGRTPKDAPEEAERIQKGKKGSVVVTSLDELRTEQEQVAMLEQTVFCVLICSASYIVGASDERWAFFFLAVRVICW